MENQEQPPQRNIRGKAKLLFMNNKQNGQKFPITVTEEEQPDGEFSEKFSSYIGYLAKDGHKFPLTEPDWKVLKKKYPTRLDEVIEEIKEIFDFPDVLNGWVKRRLNDRWRDHKSEMKKVGFTPFDSKEECLANRPEAVLPNQWPVLVNYWLLDEVKKESIRNKENKSKQTLRHKAGSKSFPRHTSELKAKLKRKPTRVEIFKKLYADPKDTSEDGPTSKIMRMEELQREDEETYDEEFDFGPNDIFAQAMGRDKGGRVRCYGPTARPDTIWGSRRASSTSVQAKENAALKEQLSNLQRKVDSMAKTLEEERCERARRDHPQDSDATPSTSLGDANTSPNPRQPF